jgi:hypothetical protein
VKPEKAQHSTDARWQIKRLKAQLDDLYLRADPRDFADPEVSGDLARYLCVRVSGYLEQSTVIICRSHCAKNSWGMVHQFASSYLDRAPNMSSANMIGLVRRFSSQIADELEAFLAIDERGARLNALVGLRNDIAHGKQQGVSREQAWSYLDLSELVVDWLIEKFDPLEAADASGKRKVKAATPVA